jgi:hypothetical protein
MREVCDFPSRLAAADLYLIGKGVSAFILIITLVACSERLENSGDIGDHPLPDSIYLPEARSCSDCRLSSELMATLGGDSLAGYLTDYPLWASMDGQSRIYVGLQPPGDLLLTFDTSGQFLGHVGKRGRGPGEFVFPVSAVHTARGEILIWDFNAAMVTTLDTGHRFVGRVHQPYAPIAVLPTGQRLVVAPMEDTAGIGYPLHLYSDSGRRVSSLGATGGKFEDSERWRLRRAASVSPRGTIWAGHIDRFRVDEWSATGEKLRTFTRTVSWMPPVTVRSAGVFGDRPTAHIEATTEDTEELLWVFSRVPSESWLEALGPPESERGTTSYPQRDQGRLYDTMVDVIDLRTGRLLVSTRHAGHIRFVLKPGVVARYREDSIGTPLLDILRIGLRGRR